MLPSLLQNNNNNGCHTTTTTTQGGGQECPIFDSPQNPQTKQREGFESNRVVVYQVKVHSPCVWALV
jgi:hypothetical protein